MFRIIRDPSSGGHLHILAKVLQIHGASPYIRHGGCIGEPVCVYCLLCGHLHILAKVLQIHGASPYIRHGGCIGELQYENTRPFRRQLKENHSSEV